MAKSNKEVKKTECPVARDEFLKHALPMPVKIGDATLVVGPREFSTGSFGWYTGDKITIMVNGKPVKVQAMVTLTVVGSKEK